MKTDFCQVGLLRLEHRCQGHRVLTVRYTVVCYIHNDPGKAALDSFRFCQPMLHLKESGIRYCIFYNYVG